MRQRVVITGLGPVSSVGSGPDEFWRALCAGETNLGRISSFDPSGYECRLGGIVEDVPVKKAVPKSYRKATKVMARDSDLAVVSAQIAAADAKLKTRGSAETEFQPASEDAYEVNLDRLGCSIGAGLLAAETNELSRALATAAVEGDHDTFSYETWGAGEGGGGAMQNLQPLWMLKYLPNMLACHVTIIHGAQGPSNTILCSESSGLLCLGESARIIERGDADACFAGGLESKLNVISHARQTAAKRLASTGDAEDGARVTKPYDPDSPGSIPGEGGALFITESVEHATSRDAPIYCELTGFGAGQSGEPLFPSLFDPEHEAGRVDLGLRRAIRAALKDAGIEPGEIDALAPTALGIPAADSAEAGALADVFGERLAEIPLIMPTTQAGASSAGHSALAAAAAALAIRHQKLPARINAGNPDPRLCAGPADAQDAALTHVLVCSSGLGGQCAAAVLKKFDT
ncbi:MAG: beta-ketoacyl synthase N-terminal-like domain-containing protein [Planctomycetota bacterium]